MGDPYGWGMGVCTILGPQGPWGGPGGPKIQVFWGFGGQGGPGGWVWASPMAPRGEGPILCLPMNPFKGLGIPYTAP